MASNPFMIDVGNPLQGLGQMAQAWGQKNAAAEAATAAAKATTEKQKEITDLIGRGDVAEMSQYMAANPQMSKGIESAFNFKSGETKRNMADGALRIISGEDPQEVIRDRAAFVSQMGGDPSHTLDALNDSPEELMQSAKVMLAQFGTPEQIKAATDLDIISKNKEKEYAQGTGVMSGYAFDKDTGTYSIDPNVKANLENKAMEKAAEGSKLDAKGRQGINKDVTSLIGDTVGIAKAADSLAALKESSSPSAQLAAIFKFMKSLDPTSVVREGEQQMARSTGGPADYLVGVVSQLQGEGSLPPAVFSDMVETSRNLADSAIGTSSKEVNDYLNAYEDTIPESFKKSLINRLPKSKAKPINVVDAPASAIDYLKANPSQAANFKAKYGYLPEGM